MVTPASITVLDVAPYNTFNLTCTATQPSSVTVTKTIEWRETRNGITKVISEDGISVNITSIDLGNPTSISSLYARVNNGSDREITCVTILEVPEDPPTFQSANAQVIVKGISYTSVCICSTLFILIIWPFRSWRTCSAKQCQHIQHFFWLHFN